MSDFVKAFEDLLMLSDTDNFLEGHANIPQAGKR